MLGGAVEEVPHTGDHVGSCVEHGRDQLLVQQARRADRVDSEIGLAAGEEVVQRGELRIGLRHDLLDARADVSLPAKQAGAGLEDPVLGAVHAAVSSLDRSFYS